MPCSGTRLKSIIPHRTSGDAKTDRLAYFICSRNAGMAKVAFSILASCIGGTATIAMIALGYQAGWAAFWWLGSGAIGLFILGLLLAKKIRQTRAASLPEVANQFMGRKCRLLSAIIVMLSSIAIVAAQFNAIGIILSALINFDHTSAILAGALAIWAYTCVGGQNAVMHSDIWQFLILAFSLLLFFIFLMMRPECRAAIAQAPFSLTSHGIPPARILYFLLVFGSSFIIGPMLFGRILSARTPSIAKCATLWAAAGLAGIAVLITMIGIAISGLGMISDSPQMLVPASLRLVMPQWGIIFVLTGLLCAVVSSADSCLISAAIVWSNDISPGGIEKTRAAMTIIALTSCAAAFSGKSILDLLLAASDIYVCGIVCPMLIALAGNLKLKSGLWLMPMSSGGICGLVSALTGNSLWSFIGLALSSITSLSICLYCARTIRDGNY